MRVVFFRKSWLGEKSPRFAQHGDTVSTTPWRKLPRTDVAEDCFCHCRDASEKLVDFTKASWQTPKKAAEVRQDDMYDVCQGLIIVWSWSAARMMKMLVTRILVPLDLNSSKARGVGLFHSGLPTTDLQKMKNLPKYKKTLWNLETLSWSAYQCLALIVCEDQELIANEVFCHRSYYTKIILIRRNSNGFKTPLPLPLILLPLQLKCKAAPKMQHSNCWQRKLRTPFSMAEVVKLDNLRKRYRFERAINTQWPIENPYGGQIWWHHWVSVGTPASFRRQFLFS